jgi:hypothetical protein
VRSPHHEALDVWIGRWVTVGPAIASIDVYEWAPSGAFVLHTTDGRIEVIDCDEATGSYTSRLYDSQGNVSVRRLTAHGDTWTYEGDATHTTVAFSDGHRVQTVHERTDPGKTYRCTMVKVGSSRRSVGSEAYGAW